MKDGSSTKRDSLAAVANKKKEKEEAARALAEKIGILPPQQQSGLLAPALLREYMHRRSFKKTLEKFDEEYPRDSDSISSRQLMIELMALQLVNERNNARGGNNNQKESNSNKSVLSSSCANNVDGEGANEAMEDQKKTREDIGVPFETIMEILCSYRLRKRCLKFGDSFGGESSFSRDRYDSDDSDEGGTGGNGNGAQSSSCGVSSSTAEENCKLLNEEVRELRKQLQEEEQALKVATKQKDDIMELIEKNKTLKEMRRIKEEKKNENKRRKEQKLEERMTKLIKEREAEIKRILQEQHEELELRKKRREDAQAAAEEHKAKKQRKLEKARLKEEKSKRKTSTTSDDNIIVDNDAEEKKTNKKKKKSKKKHIDETSSSDKEDIDDDPLLLSALHCKKGPPIRKSADFYNNIGMPQGKDILANAISTLSSLPIGSGASKAIGCGSNWTVGRDASKSGDGSVVKDSFPEVGLGAGLQGYVSQHGSEELNGLDRKASGQSDTTLEERTPKFLAGEGYTLGHPTLRAGSEEHRRTSHSSNSVDKIFTGESDHTSVSRQGLLFHQNRHLDTTSPRSRSVSNSIQAAGFND